MNGEDNYLGTLYQRFPVNVARGKGARIWDVNGKEYVDCMGGYGVALVGHCNDRVVEAIKKQADTLITAHMSVYNETRLGFMKKIAQIAPPGLTKMFFTNSGAESVEAALKFARKFTGKHGVIAMNGAYHGKTFGALSVTYNEKYRKAFMPLLDGVKFIPYGEPAKLEEAIDDTTGAVILEPIQGETGIIVPPDDLIPRIREICNRKNLVLIFDEIQAGLGRTGKMWAGQNWNTTPDIMCLAKGIAGGVPMGLVLTKPEIMDAIKLGEHSSTFGASPIACAAASATLEALTTDGLVDNAAKTGKMFKEKLMALKERHKIIREVRGLGMMLGVELRFEVKDVLLDGISNGLLMLYSGRNIIRLLPPLVMDEATVSRAVEIMDAVLTREEQRRNVN
ncbi:aspartate aminotransferase family protein [Nitrososphaera viennensis]|uniref:Acetylornithine and succinylornithine aminotransferase n=2 Tax=Nitrososphaera viennensis TaxID=1034015 RepID=A0A060HL43_9ARCH|nr:acetylornithine/succinylornithine family transaminase [Nitrososphaera viennensis]AIC15900.1 acetylornithine and succinylornithine aminotransferase [Nitrososphaera viennensis EN76]UVS67887.1 acetylornithine/succinylornithine family transaminase [Nitrososphaera viennensis]